MRDVTAQLDEFLAHKQKKVLMLKGKWGVGKTYFWKHYIGAKKTEELHEKKLSYVSLFGVGSTEEVEQLVLSKTVDLDEKKELVSQTMVLGRKGLDWLKDIPKVGEFAGLVRRIASLFVKDYLVCLDDLERRDARLTMGALLGFVSVLKEENNCRIVLILNEQELSEADQAELRKYREKVVDEEITYEPSVPDNISILAKGDNATFRLLMPFMQLGVNNIRVMQQSLWTTEFFEPFTDGMAFALRELVRDHAATLCAFYHIDALGVDVDLLDGKAPPMPGLFTAPGSEKVEQDPGVQAAKKGAEYGYNYNRVDDFIISYMRHGYCDEAGLRKCLQELNEREKRSGIAAKYHTLWKPYGANLQTQDAELVKLYRSFLDEHAGDLSEREFAETTTFLKELGYDGPMQHWQDAFVRGHLAESSVTELQRWLTSSACSDALKGDVQARLDELQAARTIPVLVHEILNGHWGEEEVALLDSYATQEVYEWLRTSVDPDLLVTVRQLCRNFSASEVGSREQSVKAKVFEALRKLASESKSNEIRVRNLFRGVLKEPAESEGKGGEGQ